jgi:hypothetical protein
MLQIMLAGGVGGGEAQHRNFLFTGNVNCINGFICSVNFQPAKRESFALSWVSHSAQSVSFTQHPRAWAKSCHGPVGVPSSSPFFILRL